MLFNLNHPLYEKYEKQALGSYNPDFFSEERIMTLAREAGLCPDNLKLIEEFISCCSDSIKKFMWLYYYILFETEEYFEDDIWVIDNWPLPEECNRNHPGLIQSVVYLASAENLKRWLKKENLEDEYLEGYYNRYRYFADLNKTEVNTYGLVKLSPFLYGYSKPFMLVIGRLTYQLKNNYDYCEVYENSAGKRIMVATPFHKYDESGHLDENGKTPVYEVKGSTLTAHTYTPLGALNPTPITINLTEYQKFLSPGDSVATIHIPGEGKLTEESVQESIDRALRIIPGHMRPIKALICKTWFIDPNLRPLFKEGANMLKFADRFDIICTEDNMNHSVFQHVFQCAPCPLDELVPKNDFQAKILQRAKQGEKIYWSYGVMKAKIK